MRRPTLSVVMPNYNHARYLPVAIGAIVAQSRRPDELLILDDGSTDDSVAVIESFVARHPWIRLVRNAQNQGAAAALARLCALAQGDYLYGAGADDFVLPEFFARAMALAEKHPRAGVVFGQLVKVDERGRALRVYGAPAWTTPVYVSPAAYLRDYLEREPAQRSLSASTIYRRACLDEVGGFRAELDHWCDTFAIRAAALEYGACYVPELCAAWRKVPASLSHSMQRSLRGGLELADRAAALMRSERFADRFPAEHVARWRRRYRRVVWLGYLRGLASEGIDFLGKRLFGSRFEPADRAIDAPASRRAA